MSGEPQPATAERTPNRSIQIHIERLVLEGFSLNGVDAAVLRSSLETELIRLLNQASNQIRPMTSGAVRATMGTEFKLAENFTPRMLGQQAARSLYQAVGSTVSSQNGVPGRHSRPD